MAYNETEKVKTCLEFRLLVNMKLVSMSAQAFPECRFVGDVSGKKRLRAQTIATVSILFIYVSIATLRSRFLAYGTRKCDENARAEQRTAWPMRELAHVRAPDFRGLTTFYHDANTRSAPYTLRKLIPQP